MSFRLGLMVLLLALIALSIVHTIVFNYLSQPLEGQSPAISRLLRRLFPGLARRADRARTSPGPEGFPIERRKTYPSSVAVLLRVNRALLETSWPILALLAYFTLTWEIEPVRRGPAWLWAFTSVGAVAVLAYRAIHQTAVEFLTELQRLDEQLVRVARPAQLWPVLRALLEGQKAVAAISLQGLVIFLGAPLLVWDNLRLDRIPEIGWIVATAALLAFVMFETFHRVRIEIVTALEAAEAQLTAPPAPSTEASTPFDAGGTPTPIDSQ